MGQIPRETIERIIDENDIVEVVGSYFPLKRAGTRMVALCPFHNEKTPSFGVNPHRQIFHCFGCGVGGDVIKFVQMYENLEFPDAAKKLAERAGIPIVEQAYDAKDEAKRQFRRELQTLQKKISEWYHRCLLRSPQAQPARDYLKSRGFGIEVAKRWQFGYAPAESRHTMDWGKKEGYTVRHLVEGGIAQWEEERRSSDGAYARFRHRLMFPIAKDFGDVIAFSGRVLSPDQKGGKYVNSPETVLFDKSKTFFGLDKSKRAIVRENRAIVVEGQLDMISAFEAGFENIVAPLGTAFTDQHARILKRQVGESGEIVLCYDSDTAGYNAAVKAFQVLAREGLLVRVAMLPNGEDPDSLIRSQGPEALRALLEDAPEFFDFQIDRHGGTRNLDSLRDRLAFVRELSHNIALIEDKMLQDSLINRVTTRLEVGDADVRRLVAEAKSDHLRTERSQKKREEAEIRRQNQKDPRSAPPSQGSLSGDQTLSNRTLRLLCQLLLNDEETRASLVRHPQPEFLRDVPGTEFLSRLWSAEIDVSSMGSISLFNDELTPVEQSWLSQLRAEDLPDTGEASLYDLALDCLQSLHRKALQNRRDAIKSRLRTPHLPGSEVESLNKELLDLLGRLSDIPPPFSKA